MLQSNPIRDASAQSLSAIVRAVRELAPIDDPAIPIGRRFTFEDLPAYSATLRNRLLRLEAALVSGRLDSELASQAARSEIGARLVRVYSSLTRGERRIASDLRWPLLEAVAFRHLALLGAPHAVYYATPTNIESFVAAIATPSKAGGLVTVKLGTDGEAVLRLDQIERLRYWGIGVRFHDPRLDQLFANYLATCVQRLLATDIGSLSDVDIFLAERELSRSIDVDGGIGSAFEELMLDVLNEKEYCAHRSVLASDFLEQTDLRLHVAGVERQRGVRVQLTWGTKGSRIAASSPASPWQDEIVFLSPFTLAEALIGDVAGAAKVLRDLRVNAGGRHLSVSRLARSLKAEFSRALTRVTDGVTGPVGHLPQSLKEFIRDYAANEGKRTTQVLRGREGQRGVWRHEVDRRFVRVGGEYVALVRELAGGYIAFNVRGMRAVLPKQYFDAESGVTPQQLQLGDAVYVKVERSDAGGLEVVVASKQKDFYDRHKHSEDATSTVQGPPLLLERFRVGSRVSAVIQAVATNGVRVLVENSFEGLIPLRSLFRYDLTEYAYACEVCAIGDAVDAEVIAEREGVLIVSLRDQVKRAIRTFRQQNPVGSELSGTVIQNSESRVVVELPGGILGEIEVGLNHDGNGLPVTRGLAQRSLGEPIAVQVAKRQTGKLTIDLVLSERDSKLPALYDSI